MEFPTLSVADFSDKYSNSVLIPFNITLSDDSVILPDNKTVSGSRDATSIVIAVCITALYSLICVVGLLGNVLVMYGVVR